MSARVETVAIIDPLGKHAGFHYYTEGTARGLVEAGRRVVVFVTALTGATPSAGYECRVAFGDLYGDAPVVRRAARYFTGLVSALWQSRRFGAKVVFLHSFHCDLRELAAVCGARLLGMKPIITMHDIESFGHSRASWIRRMMLASASGLIFQNPFSLAEFTRLYGAPPRPYAIVPHGSYIDAFPELPSRAEARAALQQSLDETILLFFGNPRAEKGLDLLIDAMGSLDRKPPWRLVIAGKMKAEQVSALKQKIHRCGIEERVTITAKHISDEEACLFYRSANLVVLPYRKIYESGVAIMAMSFSRAVLTSNLPAFLDVQGGAEVGDTFEAGNAQSLRKKIATMIQSNERLDMAGERGKTLMFQTRNRAVIGQKLAELADRV